MSRRSRSTRPHRSRWCRSLTAASRLLLAIALTLPGAALAKDPSQISAGDKETARKAMDDGDAKYAAGDYEGALVEYQEADDIMGVPTTTVLVARAYQALGKLVEARDAYLRVGRYQHTPGETMPDAFKAAQTQAAVEADALLPRIPELTIEIHGPARGEVQLSINGEAISTGSLTRRVNPGNLTVEAKAAGYLPASEKVTLAEGQKKTIALTLNKDPSYVPPPDPAPEPGPGTPQAAGDEGNIWPGAILMGLGGATAIVGGVVGIVSLVEAGDLKPQCPNETCPRDLEKDLDSVKLKANVANVMLPLGVAMAGVGLVLFFVLGDDGTEEAALTPLVGPGYMGVTGRF